MLPYLFFISLQVETYTTVIILGLLILLSCSVFAQSVDCSQCSSNLLDYEELDKLELFQLRQMKNETMIK